MMDYFNALHEYDLEIRLLRCDLYQTSAFCGHVFTVKILLKNKNTWTHGRKQMWLPDAHLCYLTLITACPCVAVLLHGATTSSAISPKMHQQNPADAPPESRGTTRIRRTPTESCLHLQRANAGQQSSSGKHDQYKMTIQLCHHWWHWRLSLWQQPPVPPIMTNLASQQLIVFCVVQHTHTSDISFSCVLKNILSTILQAISNAILVMTTWGAHIHISLKVETFLTGKSCVISCLNKTILSGSKVKLTMQCELWGAISC